MNNVLLFCLVAIVSTFITKFADGQVCDSIAWQLPVGTELEETETSSADACCSKCAALKGCSAFCFHPVSEYCHLWNHTGFEPTSGEVISGTILPPTTTTVRTTTTLTSTESVPTESASTETTPNTGTPITTPLNTATPITTTNTTQSSTTVQTIPTQTTTPRTTAETTTTKLTTTTWISSSSSLAPGECPSTGFHIIAHPYDCSKYYLCLDGDPTEYRCPDGELVDPESLECLPESEVDCEIQTGAPNSTSPVPTSTEPITSTLATTPLVTSTLATTQPISSTLSTTSPITSTLATTLSTIQTTTPISTSSTLAPGQCPPEGTHMIPYPGDCSKYFLCLEGTPLEYSCPDGMNFDPQSAECKPESEMECNVLLLRETSHSAPVRSTGIIVSTTSASSPPSSSTNASSPSSTTSASSPSSPTTNASTPSSTTSASSPSSSATNPSSPSSTTANTSSPPSSTTSASSSSSSTTNASSPSSSTTSSSSTSSPTTPSNPTCPWASGASKDYAFECTAVGLFPEPCNCQTYHMCTFLESGYFQETTCECPPELVFCPGTTVAGCEYDQFCPCPDPQC